MWMETCPRTHHPTDLGSIDPRCGRTPCSLGSKMRWSGAFFVFANVWEHLSASERCERLKKPPRPHRTPSPWRGTAMAHGRHAQNPRQGRAFENQAPFRTTRVLALTTVASCSLHRLPRYPRFTTTIANPLLERFPLSRSVYPQTVRHDERVRVIMCVMS